MQTSLSTEELGAGRPVGSGKRQWLCRGSVKERIFSLSAARARLVPSPVLSSQYPSRLRLFSPILPYYNVGRCFRHGITNKQAAATKKRKNKNKVGEVDSGNIKSDLSQQRRERKGRVEGTWGSGNNHGNGKRGRDLESRSEEGGHKDHKGKAETGGWTCQPNEGCEAGPKAGGPQMVDGERASDEESGLVCTVQPVRVSADHETSKS